MGKCKKRLLARAKNEKFQLEISREQAVELACRELNENPRSKQARDLISLFGLKAEELSEKGITYEVLRSLDGLIT